MGGRVSDTSSPEAISAYFKLLYSITDKGLDKKILLTDLKKELNITLVFLLKL